MAAAWDWCAGWGGKIRREKMPQSEEATLTSRMIFSSKLLLCMPGWCKQHMLETQTCTTSTAIQLQSHTIVHLVLLLNDLRVNVAVGAATFAVALFSSTHRRTGHLWP